jgi:hypothetical protein
MKKWFLIIFIFSSFLLYSFELPKKPMRSAFYSLVVPGGGQFYNENYWKFAGVCAVEGYFIGRTMYHQIQSDKYYDRYKKSLLEADYNKHLDYYYEVKNDYWWLGATIVLSMLDAYVDAHLYNFKENKEKINLKFIDKMIILELKF